MVLSQARVVCKSCGKERLVQDFVSKGEMMMCRSCYRQKFKEGMDLQPDRKDPQGKEYRAMACLGCNYKFRFNINSTKKLRCPYCGTGNVDLDNTTASSLLGED